MKKKVEWLTSAKLAEYLDSKIAAGWKIGDSTPCTIANELGASPNPQFYKNYDKIVAQRSAQASQPFVPATPEAEADFRNALSKSDEALFSIFVTHVGLATGLVRQDADQRVAAAELKASSASADRNQLLDSWAETEKDLVEAVDECDALGEQLAAAKLQIAKLEARLEERAALIQAIDARAAPVNVVERQQRDAGQAAGVVTHNAAPPAEVASGTGIAEPEAVPADGLDFDNRPSDSEPDHLAGDHRALPLDSAVPHPNGEDQ